MLDTSSLYVTDENGNEKRMEILFTFDDEGNLLPIETDEEWAMVEEVIGAFAEDEEAAEE